MEAEVESDSFCWFGVTCRLFVFRFSECLPRVLDLRTLRAALLLALRCTLLLVGTVLRKPASAVDWFPDDVAPRFYQQVAPAIRLPGDPHPAAPPRAQWPRPGASAKGAFRGSVDLIGESHADEAEHLQL